MCVHVGYDLLCMETHELLTVGRGMFVYVVIRNIGAVLVPYSLGLHVESYNSFYWSIRLDPKTRISQYSLICFLDFFAQEERPWFQYIYHKEPNHDIRLLWNSYDI